VHTRVAPLWLMVASDTWITGGRGPSADSTLGFS
jgi:hypothetical protein